MHSAKVHERDFTHMQIEKMRAFIIKFLYYCLILGLVYFVLVYIMPLIMPFFVAFIISYILQPLIRFFCKKTKVKENTVAVLTLIAFYCLFVSFFVLAGSQIILFLNNLFLSLPQIYTTQIEPALLQASAAIEEFFVQFAPYTQQVLIIDESTIISSISSLVTSISSSALSSATSFATSVPTLIFEFLITIISSFFFVTDYKKITEFILKLLPENVRNTVLAAKSRSFGVLVKFGRAYAILLSITFIELVIGYTLLGVQNALLLAFVTAIVDILPVLGTGTILIPWGIISLILGRYPLGFGILILYAIITVVRQTLEPRVVGNQIGLYPLVTLVCMFVGLHLFGFIGLLGVPVLVTLIVQLNKTGDLKWF